MCPKNQLLGFESGANDQLGFAGETENAKYNLNHQERVQTFVVSIDGKIRSFFLNLNKCSIFFKISGYQIVHSDNKIAFF